MGRLAVRQFCLNSFFHVFLKHGQVESLVGLLHNSPAFTSPVDEVVAWGEDTWP